MSRIDVAVGVVRDNVGRVLIARRKAGTHLGSLWEFPGGKIEPAEDIQQALNRELYEELGIRLKGSIPLINVNFTYPECQVCLHVREVYDFDGMPIGQEGQKVKWVSLQELGKYMFPEANKTILSALKLSRHYAIVGGNDIQQLLSELDIVAEQGVSLVQIRAKDLDESGTEEVLDVVREKCHKLGVTYLINSQMKVKRSMDDGVHLTSTDLMALRRRPDCVGFVAASCHNLDELYKAEQLALDFVVLSPVMETASHLSVDALGWRQFSEWVSKVNIPVFALGGIGKQDYQKALNFGAQGISGIRLYRK